MEKIYRESDNGEIIKGIGLPAFIHNFQYHLVLIKVYEDGVIDCWGKLNFDEFVEKVNSGWVVTKVPEDATVSRHHSFYGTSDGLNTYIDESEFIKEVKDTLNKLQGKKTSSIRCREAFNDYLHSPNENNAEILKEAYNVMPNHLKRYVLGDMDVKDGPIRYVLEDREVDEERLNAWRERYIENAGKGGFE